MRRDLLIRPDVSIREASTKEQGAGRPIADDFDARSSTSSLTEVRDNTPHASCDFGEQEPPESLSARNAASGQVDGDLSSRVRRIFPPGIPSRVAKARF